MQTCDDIQGFLMLCMPKKAYWVSEKERMLNEGQNKNNPNME